MLSAFGVYRKLNSAQEAQQNEGSTLALALALRHATQAQAQGLTPVLVPRLEAPKTKENNGVERVLALPNAELRTRVTPK